MVSSFTNRNQFRLELFYKRLFRKNPMPKVGNNIEEFYVRKSQITKPNKKQLALKVESWVGKAYSLFTPEYKTHNDRGSVMTITTQLRKRASQHVSKRSSHQFAKKILASRIL